MSTPPWRRIAAHGGLAVLLIRHGRTGLNAERRFCGAGSDPSLDETGREQAMALRTRLGDDPQRWFCSPQLRARETASLLAPEARPTILDELRELDQGQLEGLPIAEALREHAEFFAAWKRDPSDVRVPGGESMGELADRVALAMAEVLRQATMQDLHTVAVVGHQMAQAAFVCRALAQPLSRWTEFQLHNASANLLAWDGQTWSLQGRNL
ncbi:MAG: histidine phosphatase family protein [Myxococcales bacterium]|nr:histidine phosphatase family protein [Myxococcales bacterium]